MLPNVAQKPGGDLYILVRLILRAHPGRERYEPADTPAIVEGLVHDMDATVNQVAYGGWMR